MNRTFLSFLVNAGKQNSKKYAFSVFLWVLFCFFRRTQLTSQSSTTNLYIPKQTRCIAQMNYGWTQTGLATGDLLVEEGTLGNTLHSKRPSVPVFLFCFVFLPEWGLLTLCLWCFNIYSIKPFYPTQLLSLTVADNVFGVYSKHIKRTVDQQIGWCDPLISHAFNSYNTSMEWDWMSILNNILKLRGQTFSMWALMLPHAQVVSSD